MKRNFVHNVNIKNNQNQKRPKYGNQNDKVILNYFIKYSVLRERDMNVEYHIQPNILGKMNDLKQKQNKIQFQKNDGESSKQNKENDIKVQSSHPKIDEKIDSIDIDSSLKQNLQIKIQTIPKIQSLYKDYFNKKRKELQSYFSTNKDPVISIEDMLSNSELKKVFGEFFSHQPGQKTSNQNKRKHRVEKDIDMKSEETNLPGSRKIYEIKVPKVLSLPFCQQQQTNENQQDNKEQIKNQLLLTNEIEIPQQLQFNQRVQFDKYGQFSKNDLCSYEQKLNNNAYINNHQSLNHQELFKNQGQLPNRFEINFEDSFRNKGQILNAENLKYRENNRQMANLKQIDQSRRIQNIQNEQNNKLLFGNKQNIKQEFDSYELLKLQEKQQENVFINNHRVNKENDLKQQQIGLSKNQQQQNQKNMIDPYVCYYVNQNQDQPHNNQKENQLLNVSNNQVVSIHHLGQIQSIYDQQQHIYDQQQLQFDNKQIPYYYQQAIPNVGNKQIRITDEQKKHFYEDKENYQPDQNKYYLNKQKTNNLAIDYQKYNNLKEKQKNQIRVDGMKKINAQPQIDYLIQKDVNLIQQSIEDQVLNRDYMKNIFEPKEPQKNISESILKRHSLSFDEIKECPNEYYNNERILQISQKQQYLNNQIQPNFANKNLHSLFSNNLQFQQEQQNEFKNKSEYKNSFEYQNQPENPNQPEYHNQTEHQNLYEYKNESECKNQSEYKKQQNSFQNQQDYYQQKYQNQYSSEKTDNNYNNHNQSKRIYNQQYQEEPRIQTIPFFNSSSKKINIFNLMSNQKRKLEDQQLNEGIQIFRSSKKNY